VAFFSGLPYTNEPVEHVASNQHIVRIINFYVYIGNVNVKKYPLKKIKDFSQACGKAVRGKVRNEIRERTEVESNQEHLREQRLRWFGHMKRIDCEGHSQWQ